MANVLLGLATGVFYVIRVVVCLIGLAMGLSTLVLPWRTIAVLHWLGDAGCRLNELTFVGFGSFAAAIADLIVIVLFVITLVSWRGPSMLKEISVSFENTDKVWNPNLRLAVVVSFGYYLSEIPFFVMSLLSTVMVWRAPFFWYDFYNNLSNRRLLLKGIAINTAIGLVDILLLPFGLILIFSWYRIRPASDDVASIKDSDREALLHNILRRRLAVLKHGILVIVDFFFLLLGIITVLFMVRVTALVRDWKAAKGDAWKRREAVMTNLLLSFRELLALVAYCILLPFGLRFYLAVQKVREQTSDQADPRPHAIVTKLTPEFPSEGGIKLHLEGTKIAGLGGFKQADLYVREVDFFGAVSKSHGSAAATMVKGFLPYRLTPNTLQEEDFKAGVTDFTTTLHFKVKASKKGIVKNLRKISSYKTTINLVIEFGDHDGVLMNLPLDLQGLISCAESGGELPVVQEANLAYDTMEGMRATEKKVAGELVCDVMAIPAFLQLAWLFSDLFALVFFVLLHLLPWRAYTMYRSVFDDAQTKQLKKRISLLHRLKKLLKRSPNVKEAAAGCVDEQAKNGRLASWGHRYPYYAQFSKDSDKGISALEEYVDSVLKGASRIEMTGGTEEASIFRAYLESVQREHVLYCAVAVEIVRYVSSIEPGGSRCPSVTCADGSYDISTACPWLHRFPLAKELGCYTVQRGQMFPEATSHTIHTTRVRWSKGCEDEGRLQEQLRSELDRCLATVQKSQRGLSCGAGVQVDWTGAKNAVFSAVLQLAKDFLAVLCCLVVVCTVYRIPVLWSTLKTSKTWHETCYWNLGQILVDILYLVKALCVVLAVRNAFSMALVVGEVILRGGSYEELRNVVDFFFRLAGYDFLSLITALLTWKAIKWGVGAVAVGILAPGFMLQAVVISDGIFIAGCIVFLVSAWFYAFPVTVAALVFDSENPNPYIFVYLGSLGAVLLVLIAYKFDDDGVVGIVPSRFLRFNWFNGLQFFYTALESALLVAVTVVAGGNKEVSPWKELLLDFSVSSSSYPLGIWVTCGLFVVFFFVIALPIVAIATQEGESELCKYNSWVFWMQLLSQGLQVFIVYHLMSMIVCIDKGSVLAFNEDVSCWTGSHRTVGILSIIAFSFYVLTSVRKIPEYSTSHCTLLDIVFAPRYEAHMRCAVVMGTVGAVLAGRAEASAGSAVVFGALLWQLGYTLWSPRSNSSSLLYMVWKALCCGLAMAGVVAVEVHRHASLTAAWVTFGVLAALCIVAALVKVRQLFLEDIVELSVTPEQLQGTLEEVMYVLRDNACLTGRFDTGAWLSKVRGNIRSSQLALQLMELECNTHIFAVHPTFLISRAAWYSDLWKMVDSDDHRLNYASYSDYYDSDSDYCEANVLECCCPCCMSKPSCHNNESVNSIRDLSVLERMLQQFTNAVRQATGSQDPVDDEEEMGDKHGEDKDSEELPSPPPDSEHQGEGKNESFTADNSDEGETDQRLGDAGAQPAQDEPLSSSPSTPVSNPVAVHQKSLPADQQ